SGGDINLYSLFVERASTQVRRTGMVGLLTPSGIAADKGAARFFSGIATGGRLAALLDFENRKTFFPDIHASFKFCALVFGGAQRRFEAARCAFFLHAVDELQPPALPDDADERERQLATRVIPLTAADFAAVNPNTGTAPIFRNALDAELTTRIYAQHPVLVRRRTETRVQGRNRREVEIEIAEPLYPARYRRTFDMTNDSNLFRTRSELEADGWYPVAGGRWRKGETEMLPLYVGRMIHHYDHRAASVTVNEENLHNAALSGANDDAQKQDPTFFPTPQYWVPASSEQLDTHSGWAIAFRDIARATDARTFIAAIVPQAAARNTLPFVLQATDTSATTYSEWAPFFLANVSSFALDFVARQKVQSTHLNWYVVEQLPLISQTR